MKQKCEIIQCSGVYFNSMSIAPGTYVALCQKHYDEEMSIKYGTSYQPTEKPIPTTNTSLCDRCDQEKPWLVMRKSERWGQYFLPNEINICLECLKQDKNYIQDYKQLP